MNWLEVQASNVAAIAYDADIYTLAIRYRDGLVYVCPNVSATAFGALATSNNKDKIISKMVAHWIRITEGGASAKAPSETKDPFEVIDEDASPCCHERFRKFPPTDIGMTCPKCGTQFVPEMVGPVRHWRIKAAFAVVRPQ